MNNTLTAPSGAQAPAPAAGSPQADRPFRNAGFFERSDLGRALWQFRREFAWVLIFSCFANVLLLTPTLYMLQVFDRVLLSGSELTLLVLTIVTVFFFLVMGFAEWVRARLLVRAGAQFDQALNTRVFDAMFGARLNGATRNPIQPLSDLTQLRQFLTGNGIFALADTPWSVVFIAVLFLMHPLLGWSAIGFCVVQLTLAYIGHRVGVTRHQKVASQSIEVASFLQAKLRNAETVEALGMLGHFRRRFLGAHQLQMSAQAEAQELQRRVQAITKFVQYVQQSMMLALGALLAIDGTISPGAMIASNALASNALRPIGLLGQAWRQFVDARQSYGRLEAVLNGNPERLATHDGTQVQGQISLRQLEATAPGGRSPSSRVWTLSSRRAKWSPSSAPRGQESRHWRAACWGSGLQPWRGAAGWTCDRNMVACGAGPHWAICRRTSNCSTARSPRTSRGFVGRSPVVIEAATRAGIHDMILRMPKGYDYADGRGRRHVVRWSAPADRARPVRFLATRHWSC